MKNFLEYINNNIVIFDGAFGTELQKKGLKIGEAPEKLNLSNQSLVYEVNKSYADAGADIISSNTFGANCIKLDKGEVERIVKAGLKIARMAAGEEKFVALDIGPLGELLEPMGTLSFADAYEAYRQIVVAGEGACDVILIETMTDLRELKCALLAAKENSSKPIMCSMSFEENHRTFTGCTPESFALTASAYADVIGVNCSLGPKQILPIMKRIALYSDKPLFIMANAGLPDENGMFGISPEEFADLYEEYIQTGVCILGGCCGTTPEHIRKIVEMVAKKSYVPRKTNVTSAVCTANKVVNIDAVRIIGERINPTGKKAMKKALIENDMGYISSQALSQIEAGAEILDVNAGLPELDEEKTLLSLIKHLQSITDVPLQIDSSSPRAVESALREYCGKAIVNSVNGEDEKLNSLLPIIKKYGAAVVGLTIDKDGIPKSVEKRVEIAEKIIKRAKEHGIEERDIYIDCLTLTVSAEQEQAMMTLRAIRQLKARHSHIHFVLGVSNVSFGLPARQIINSSFLTLAMYEGLDLPILNPNVAENMQAVAAFNVITCKDKNSAYFTEKYASFKTAVPVATEKKTEQGKEEGKDIFYYIRKGLDDAKVECAKLLESKTPIEVIDEYLIPALNEVGDLYEKGTLFLPQLIAASESAKKCFELVKERIGSSQSVGEKIVIATVKGDVHDIGKNIVKTVLENYGFKVIDLGKNVEPELIVNTCKEQSVTLCGLSALMTTTVEYMKETIALMKEQYPECKIMVGGAVLTPDYAAKIGADYYAKDANQSVKIAQKHFRQTT